MIIHLNVKGLLYDGTVVINHTILTDELLNTLWFLKSLFICYVIYALLALLRGGLRIAVLIVFILITPFVGFYHLSLMIPSFLAGLFVREKKLHEKRWILYFSGLLFMTLLFIWNADFLRTPAHIITGFLSGDFNPMEVFLFRYITSLLIGLSGGLFFMSLFEIIFCSNENRLVERISKWGQYTMGVYILQMIILETIFPQFIQLDGTKIVTQIIVIPLLSVIVLILCIFLQKCLMNYSFINRYLLGKV